MEHKYSFTKDKDGKPIHYIYCCFNDKLKVCQRLEMILIEQAINPEQFTLDFENHVVKQFLEANNNNIF